jgi:protein-S-isoprenylcysteine O-methyltransferase Ste14
MISAWLWVAWLVYWYAAAIFVQRTKSAEGLGSRLKHVLPLMVGAVLIFHGRPWIGGWLYESKAVGYGGNVITAAGLGFAVWARLWLGRYWSGIITVKEGHRLIRGGPYRLVRHPIYTGFLMGMLGSAISAATVDGFLGFAVIAAALFFKIGREEAVLIGEFGEEYRKFKAEVPALVPLVY